MQSAGAAISWRIDAIGTGFLLQLCLCWGMTILALPAAFIVALSIKETNYQSSIEVVTAADDDIEKKAEKQDDDIEEKTEKQDNDVERNPREVEAKGIRTWIHGLVMRIKK